MMTPTLSYHDTTLASPPTPNALEKLEFEFLLFYQLSIVSTMNGTLN